MFVCVCTCTLMCSVFSPVAPLGWVQVSGFLKWEIHVAFRLFHNVSIELEQMHAFNTSIAVGLTAFSPSAGRDALLSWGMPAQSS